MERRDTGQITNIPLASTPTVQATTRPTQPSSVWSTITPYSVVNARPILTQPAQYLTYPIRPSQMALAEQTQQRPADSVWSAITPSPVPMGPGQQRRVDSVWSEITPYSVVNARPIVAQPAPLTTHPIRPSPMTLTEQTRQRPVDSVWSAITPSPAPMGRGRRRTPSEILAAIKEKKQLDSVWSQITSQPPSAQSGPLPPGMLVPDRPRILDSVWSEITPSPSSPLGNPYSQQPISLAQLVDGGRRQPDAVSELLIPLADTASVGCEKCGETVEGGYANRRAHVHVKHPPAMSEIILESQAALKEMMGACFPDSVVQNDLTCNYAGCGREVALYKSCPAVELQRRHIQHFHLDVIDEEICPLMCPVKGCIKWGPTRRDERSLRNHIDNAHTPMQEEDHVAYMQLIERLKSATEKRLSIFFPHTPKGLIVIGMDNNTLNGRKKTTRLDCFHTRPSVDVASRKRPLPARDPEPSGIECEDCKKVVSSSYLERRKHVVATHLLTGELKGTTAMEQQDTLKMATSRCFPGATVLNDLMCNYTGCGMEARSFVGKTVKELQGYHIQEHHIHPTEAEAEAALITCPVADCKRMLWVMSHKHALSSHLAHVHGGMRRLSTADSKTYRQIIDRIDKATEELHPQCFPYTPSGPLIPSSRGYRKRTAQPDEEIDQSIFLDHY